MLGFKAGRLVFDGPPASLTDAAIFEIFGEIVSEPSASGDADARDEELASR